ncbi:MAG: sarcosine oxidase subunit delta [Arenicellales bacterium WSBS_2016_MAG_OTU3]
MRITCPYCGIRDHSEFTYCGDATLQRPENDKAEDALAWKEYVYERANPATAHKELWHHTSGCRCWITVERNIRTHEITAVHCMEAKHAKHEDPGHG